MSLLTIIAILVVGLILILAELLVLPGFGIAGFLGVCALVAGAAAAWVELSPVAGVVAGLTSIVLTGLVIYLVPRTKAGRRLVLTDSQQDSFAQPSYKHLIGKTGVTLNRLRPGGTARFGEEEVDVITEGEYVEPEHKVVVVAVEGVRVVVRAKSTEEG